MASTVPNYYRKAYQDFTGGLKSRPNPLQIEANKFTLLENAILNDEDTLQKVQGYTLDGMPFPNSSDSFIRFLINYKVGDSISTLVCAALDAGNSNTLYKVDLKQSYGDGTYNYIGHTLGTSLFTHGSAAVVGLSTLWTKHLKAGDKIGTGTQPSTWYEILSVNSDTSITLSSLYAETTTTSTSYMARIILSSNSIPVGLVFNNKLIISNGSETPMETDNTSLGKFQSANWVPVKLLELHKNRVFGSSWSASPSGLMWTYANDETTVDPTSYATVFPNDNGHVVKIKSYANSLLVFKDNGNIYQVVGEFDQSAAGQPAMIRKIDTPDNVGVISGQSVCIIEGNPAKQIGSKIMFLSETGIYSINSYMQVQKESWDIQPTLANLLLKSTATATKQYGYTSKGQWDTGTTNSLSDTRVTGGMSTFFDTLNLSTALQGNGKVATYIDSTNNVHTAYVGSDGKSVRYNHWLASDNSNTDTEVCNVTSTTGFTTVSTHLVSADAVAISVAPNGNIGVVVKTHTLDLNGSPGGRGTGKFYYFFSEFTSGAWTHTKIKNGTQTDETVTGHSVSDYSYLVNNVGISTTYDGSSNPSVFITQGNSSQVSGGVTFFNGSGCTYLSRSGATWTTGVTVADQQVGIACNMVVDSSSNILIVIATSAGTVRHYKSADGGSTFTNPKNITVSGTTPRLGTGHVDIVVNSLLDPILIYNFTSGTGGDVGKTVRYNVTSSTSSYVDTSANYLKGYVNRGGLAEFMYTIEGGQEKFTFETTYTGGTAILTNGSTTVTGTATKWGTWAKAGDLIKLATDAESDYVAILTVNSDTSITLASNYGGSTAGSPSSYVIKRSNSVTSSGTAVASTAYYVGSTGMSNSTNTVATVTYGLNANEIRLRRTTLFGQWYSGALTDSSLASWGTYTVTDPVSNGNTILYEVGLSTNGSITESNISTIVPGSVISGNPTFTTVEGRLSFTLTTFAQSSVGGLTLNYVGTGVDAKLPFGYVYNNEMYLSVTTPSGTGNNEIIFLDRKGSWGIFTVGTCAMTRYNQQLYIGDSTSGKIYKFRQGYNLNSSAYSLKAITKEDLLGSIELQKDIYKVYVIYETKPAGTVTFSYRFDTFLDPNSSDTTGWTDTVIDQTVGSIQEITGMAGQRCSSVQFKIQQDDSDVQVGIVGFIILYTYYNIR